MLRKHYHNTEYLTANAKRKVSQYIRDLRSTEAKRKKKEEESQTNGKKKIELTNKRILMLQKANAKPNFKLQSIAAKKRKSAKSIV